MMRKIIFLLLFGGQWLMASGQQGEVGGQRSEVYNAGKMPTLQVAGGTPALQEAVQEATLDSCRRWARENYPLVEQYGLVKQSAEYSVENASRGWLPQVRLTAQATWQTDAARFPDQMNTMLATMGTEIEGMRQDQYKVVVDVQQYLWDGGRSAAEKQMAQAQAQADGLTADVDFYALEGRVDNLFFGILLLERQIALTEMRISLLEENLRRCRVMAENDMLMQSDVDAVEVELLTAGQRREELQGSRDAYREMLSLLTGRNLRGEALKMPEKTDLTLSQESRRPELQLLDAQSRILKSQEQMVKVATMPQVSAFAQGWYGYPGLNMFENMRNGDWSLNAIVGVRLTWNISGYYTQGNRLEQLRIGQQQLRVKRDVFEFNNNLQRTQENAEIGRLTRALSDDERIVALRRSVREAAETKLANGTISTSELLRTIVDESAAQSTRLLHEIELLKKQYERERRGKGKGER